MLFLCFPVSSVYDNADGFAHVRWSINDSDSYTRYIHFFFIVLTLLIRSCLHSLHDLCHYVICDTHLLSLTLHLHNTVLLYVMAVH